MTHNHTIHNIGIASQIGSYSDAVEVGGGHRWLHISGTPGLSKNGNMPDNIKEQTELAWDNIMQLLKAADMDVEDIVKITQYLTRTGDILEYSKTSKGYLGNTKPASTLLITPPQLGWDNMLVEIEVIAAKK